MTAKEFMEEVRRAERELVSISAKRRHYEELATSISVNLTGMPGKQGGSSRVEAGAIGLIDMTEQLRAKEIEYTALCKKAQELIAKIPQDNFRDVLTFKYLCGWSWRSIQDQLKFKDQKSVYRCHGFALKELQKVM